MPSTDDLSPRTPVMYPLPSSPSPSQRMKRRQVKNACTNCQKACKKCDDARPCLRCVKYGVQETCISSQRKERKRGVKRGPYKKRGSKDHSSTDQPDSSCRQETHLPQPLPLAPNAPPILPSYMPVGLPTPLYAPPHSSKNGGAPSLYHPYFLSQMPLLPPPPSLQAPQNEQDDVNPTQLPPPQPGPYYSAALVAQFSPNLYPQYTIPRPDLQPLPQNIHYAFFPPTSSKQLSYHDNNHNTDHGESSR